MTSTLNGPQWNDRGRECVAGGRLDDALVCYTHAVELCGHDAAGDTHPLVTYLANRAHVHLGLRNYGEGVEAGCPPP